MFRCHFGKLFLRKPSRPARRRRPAPPKPRLVLETLEQRCLPSFLSPIPVPVSFNEAMAVGDFTNDGIPDLVTIRGSTTVSVLPGNGDGSFQSPIDTRGLPNGDHALAVGHLTGDGNLDAVVTTHGVRSGDGNFVSVLLGNGDGTFQAPVNYQLDMVPTSVAVADFRGDGRPDLVVSSDTSFGGSPTGTEILMNNGDGTFSPTVTLPIIHSVVGHFTADGKLDIAGVSGNNSISVFLGNGDGTFQAPVTSQVDGEGIFSLAVGDFNGDGIDDLAATVFFDTGVHSTRVYGLLSQGDGTFQENPAGLDILRYGATPTLVGVADFYGDGTPGLVVGDATSSGDVVVLRSAGDGSFRIGDSFPGVFAGGDLIGAVGDFNGDGLPDFAVANSSSSPIQVFLNAGSGGIVAGAAVSGPAGSRTFADPQGGFAAIDAVFASAQPTPLSPVVVNQQPAVAAVDAALSTSRLEAVPMPEPQQAVIDTGIMPDQPKGDRTEAAKLADLADPLAVAV